MRNLFLIVVLAFAVPVCAQTAPPQASAPQTRLVSPQVLPDHRVVFRLRAPKASEVTIAGDFWVEQNRTEKLMKDAQGIWSLTTEALTPDYYSYWFTVDGMRIPDPANGLVKPGVRVTQSAFFVPGPEESYLEATAVPHGDVRIVYFHSAVLGKLRRMHIYFPPGYEMSQKHYPVLYLFHGGGDDDAGWDSIGRVNFILDNLIAEGKAKPMIVVMPSLWALDPPLDADQMVENESLFQRTLVGDIIPWVEKQYRVLPGAANRAVGGLGLGRSMLTDVVWPSFDKFSYVGFVSGGLDPDRLPILEKQYPGVFEDAANTNRVKFFLGDGVNDSSIGSSRFLLAELKRRGYRVTSIETTGTHGWPSFRRCFAEFAQVAFR